MTPSRTSNMDPEFRQVLAQLELLSHGSTQAWNPSGGQSGEPDDKIIIQVITAEQPPHLLFRARYEQQADEVGRRRVLEQAKAALSSWARRSENVPAGESEEEIFRRRVLEKHGWSAVELARSLRCTPGRVRRTRAANACEPEFGDRQQPVGDRVAFAAGLEARGYSQVEIAEWLGVSQPTVHRWLKTRRAA